MKHPPSHKCANLSTQNTKPSVFLILLFSLPCSCACECGNLHLPVMFLSLSPIHVFSEVSSAEFNGTSSQVNIVYGPIFSPVGMQDLGPAVQPRSSVPAEEQAGWEEVSQVLTSLVCSTAGGMSILFFLDLLPRPALIHPSWLYPHFALSPPPGALC